MENNVFAEVGIRHLDVASNTAEKLVYSESVSGTLVVGKNSANNGRITKKITEEVNIVKNTSKVKVALGIVDGKEITLDNDAKPEAA